MLCIGYMYREISIFYFLFLFFFLLSTNSNKSQTQKRVSINYNFWSFLLKESKLCSDFKFQCEWLSLPVSSSFCLFKLLNHYSLFVCSLVGLFILFYFFGGSSHNVWLRSVVDYTCQLDSLILLISFSLITSLYFFGLDCMISKFSDTITSVIVPKCRILLNYSVKGLVLK